MTVVTARKSLATLALLACLMAVTSAAFVAVHFAQWDGLSLVLAMVLIVLVIVCIRVLLDALENWVERAEHHDGGDQS